MYLCTLLRYRFQDFYIYQRQDTMISIGYRKLTVGDFYKILFEDEKVEIDAGALRRVSDNFEFLKEFAKGKVIYGINTGLGPMAQYKINGNRELELQYNLIRSHSAGCGAPLERTSTSRQRCSPA
jgi:histidine ammonia-lyase